jgi:GNAT superfamily N-acetyltransferase
VVLVRETVAQDWRALRDIRLAALQDAPDAFASTYAEQAAFTEADWQDRISRGGTFLAYVPEVSACEPTGLAGGFLREERPGTVALISMFVRPQARGRQVGEALIAAVAEWGRARQARTMDLWVTETNSPARLLYERCGFSLTGERQPLPSNPGVIEVAMARPL